MRSKRKERMGGSAWLEEVELGEIRKENETAQTDSSWTSEEDYRLGKLNVDPVLNHPERERKEGRSARG